MSFFYAYSYFLLFFIKQITLTIKANISATNTDNQIPFIPINSGNINITITWNTKVLKNDIKAETNPLLSAVKNDEANILNQLII